MALETGTYISSLVPSNPVGATDDLSTADDHLRLIKSTIKNTFPNVTGEVAATQAQLNVLDNVSAVSVIGRAANSAGDPAAIAAGANDRILRRTGDALNFGQLTAGMFPNTVVPDAALSSNVPLLNAENTFTDRINISNGGPVFRLTDTDGGTNEKIWQVDNVAGFRIITRDDGGGLGSTAIGISRSGTSVTEIELNATLLDFNGAADFSSTITAAGQIIAPQGTQAAPGFCFAGDTDVGIYRSGTNTLSIVGANTVRASFSSSLCQLNATEVELNGALDFNGAADFSSTVAVGGAVTLAADVSMTGTRAIDATTRLDLTGATVSVGESGGNLGFFGGAGGGKPNVAGARDDAAIGGALYNLLIALQTLGLITNSTTQS